MAPYPTKDELRAEAWEATPAVVLTVTDSDGNVVRRLEGPVKKGFHRVAWDLRFAASTPAKEDTEEKDPWDFPDQGPFVVPGTFQVSLATRVDGVLTPVAGMQRFEVVPLGHATLPASDRPALLAFQKKAARLQRAVLGCRRGREGRAGPAQAHHDRPARHPHRTCRADHPGEVHRDPAATARPGAARRSRHRRAQRAGAPVHRGPGAGRRLHALGLHVGGHRHPGAEPGGGQSELFETNLKGLQQLVEVDLKGLETAMEKAGAPYTPGRFPVWTKE